MDVEKYLTGDDRLMLVTGAAEQHGYLSLLADFKILLALTDAASKTTGVLVAPPPNYGASSYFLEYPGTLRLRASPPDGGNGGHHPLRVRARFQVHPGSQRARREFAARAQLHELSNDLPDLRLNSHDWWSSHSIEAVAAKHELKPAHANSLEAFAFTIVGEVPDGSKVPPRVPRAIMDSRTAREVYGDGSFGGPYRAGETLSMNYSRRRRATFWNS